MTKKILLVFALLTGFMQGVSAQQVAIKTNLFMWATATLNLGAEVAVSDHSTLSLEAHYNPWTFGTKAKVQNWFLRPEYRYWFTGKFTRSFIGAHLIAGQYEIGGFSLPFGVASNLSKQYYKGWALGAGVTFGYHFYISPHFNLELAAGVGYARLRNRTTIIGKADTAPTNTRHYFGPTNASISFVYLFNSKK